MRLIANLHHRALNTRDHLIAKATTEPERGSETIEKVLWAVAVIVIVGIVVTAINGYVTREAAKIN